MSLWVPNNARQRNGSFQLPVELLRVRKVCKSPSCSYVSLLEHSLRDETIQVMTQSLQNSSAEVKQDNSGKRAG